MPRRQEQRTRARSRMSFVARILFECLNISQHAREAVYARASRSLCQPNCKRELWRCEAASRTSFRRWIIFLRNKSRDSGFQTHGQQLRALSGDGEAVIG